MTDLVSIRSVCPLCGGEHAPGPMGAPDGPFAGVEFKICPKLPPDHLYEHQEFEVGPPGRLYRIVSKEDER